MSRVVVARKAFGRKALGQFVGRSHAGSTPAPSYDPSALFESGTYKGWLYDPRVAANLAQLSDGTVAVGSGDPVGYITDLSGTSKHATQTVSGSRGTFPGIALDGADDNYRITLGRGYGTIDNAMSFLVKVRADNASAAAGDYQNLAARVGCCVANYRQLSSYQGYSEPFCFGLNEGKVSLGVACNAGDPQANSHFIIRSDDALFLDGDTHTIGFLIVTFRDEFNVGQLSAKLYFDGVVVKTYSSPLRRAIDISQGTDACAIGTRLNGTGGSVDRLQGDLGPSIFINRELTDSDFADLHAWAMS